MRDEKTVIIDTGCANVNSVRFAIERLGYRVSVTCDEKEILRADKLFLPGVGTASEAMKNLASRNLIGVIEKVEQPLLGICLGMQLLGGFSEEASFNQVDVAQDDIASKREKETVQTLGLIEANTHLMHPKSHLKNHSKNQTSQALPLPHMGWNTVNAQKDHPLFKNIPKDSYFYFVHRYAMPINESTVAQCCYGDSFSASVQKGHFFGVQFHPERSSNVGAQLIKNFLQM